MGIEINNNNKFDCDICYESVILVNKTRDENSNNIWICNDCCEKYPKWKS